MKVGFISDAETQRDIPSVIFPEHLDVLCLCGDIGAPSKIDELEKFLSLCKETSDKVLYLPGNHEYEEGMTMERVDSILSELCRKTGCIYMQNNKFAIEGVTFLGCTMWTSALETNEIKKYRQIFFDILPKSEGKMTVVLTHHRPLSGAIDDPTVGEDVRKRFTGLWAYGHSHERRNVDGNGFLTNAIGYKRELPGTCEPMVFEITPQKYRQLNEIPEVVWEI